MSRRYAADTEISVERTRAEIETVLTKYGADAFGYQTQDNTAKIAFRMKGRYYRFSLTLPPRDTWEFNFYKQGRSTFQRADGVAQKLWEQACRSRWRALLLVIRAKLEAVEIGITTLEDEFMAAMVLPSGATMAEEYGPQIEDAYRIGAMPKRLMLEGPDA